MTLDKFSIIYYNNNTAPGLGKRNFSKMDSLALARLILGEILNFAFPIPKLTQPWGFFY